MSIRSGFPFPLRVLAWAGCIFLGLLAIVGSGGGALGFPEGEIRYDPDATGLSVSVIPAGQIVQAGDTARFDAIVLFATGPVSYQWRRNGVDIAGATAAVYILDGAQLGDDGAVFQVVAQAASGSSTAGATLLVSPLPPVVFEDGDFSAVLWTTSGASEPVHDGPTYTIVESPDGGHPGAYRHVSNRMSAGVSALQIVHLRSGAIYDPRTDGGLYTLGFAIECAALGRDAGVVLQGTPFAAPTFEQAGRTYRPREGHGYCRTGWQFDATGNLTADRFVQASGPPCGTGEACPDFAPTAPPLRFGFTSHVATAAGSSAGEILLGVDNWRTTLWRR